MSIHQSLQVELFLRIAWVAMTAMIVANYAGFARWYLFKEEGGAFLVFLSFSLVAAGALSLSQAQNAITLLVLLFTIFHSTFLASITWREGKRSVSIMLAFNCACAIAVIMFFDALTL